MATGSIERLPSGKHRAVVYAGLDPLTRTRSYLKGPARTRHSDAVADLDHLRAEALNGPGHTRARFAAVLERYLQTATIAPPTRVDYRRRVNRVIALALGHIPLGKIDVPLLEEFQADLLRCSQACDGTRTDHVCKPLSPADVRHHMAVVSGALSMAVRYHWIGHNSAREIKRLRIERDERIPPTAADVARAITCAFELELALGLFLWLTAITGAHRSEILKLRFKDIQLLTVPPRLTLGPAYMVIDGTPTFTAGKRHKTRYVALDEFTAYLLTWYRIWRIQTVGGHRFSEDDFLFPGLRAKTHGQPRNPDAVTHAITRLGQELGIHLTPTLIRHYNATELLDAGLNIATVAARLGQADGGATLLRVYAHTKAASDTKAAETAARAVKTPQITALNPRRRLATTPEDIQPHPHTTRLKHLAKLPPYQLIAHDIRTAIKVGTLQPGDQLPPIKDLAHWYNRSVATIHRALTLLTDEHLLDIRTGHRTRIAHAPEPGTAKHSDTGARGITVESPALGESTHTRTKPGDQHISPAHGGNTEAPASSPRSASTATHFSDRRSPSSSARPEARSKESAPPPSAGEIEPTHLSAFYCEHTRTASRVHALIHRVDGTAELRAILTVKDPDLAERARRALNGELYTPPQPARPTEIRHITRQLPEPYDTIFTLALHHARHHTWPTNSSS